MPGLRETFCRFRISLQQVFRFNYEGTKSYTQQCCEIMMVRMVALLSATFDVTGVSPRGDSEIHLREASSPTPRMKDLTERLLKCIGALSPISHYCNLFGVAALG